jgi:xylan 1,4-beta-xylosidase
MDESIQATIEVDCADFQGTLKRIWASIGYDEINWTYTPRGKALYRTLHKLAEVPYYVRNHNAFTSGNGLSSPAWGSTNIYHELPDGSITYYWTASDQVYDVISGAGFRPLIELGFLPRDLVPARIETSDWERDVGQENYESDGLWKYPPKDYDKWAELVYQFVTHLVARYGRDQVETWRFELWNEPDIPHYWLGSLEEYCKLYDYSVAAAVRALPTISIGGPGSTSPNNVPAGDFLDGFLRHCTSGRNAVTGETGTRLDFISFHTKGAHYATRRYYNLQQPIKRETASSAVMMGDIRAGLNIIARYPELRDRPVFVDECDPAVGTIYGVYDNPNFIITNTQHYPTFLCALVKRVLDLNNQYGDPISLITTWAFYFEGKRFFEGNRTLVTSENIDKPVLNAFRMLGRMGHTRLATRSSHSRDVLAENVPQAEVDALAALSGERVTALIWHQADEWWLEGDSEVSLRVANLPFSGDALVRHYRIDDDHSNSYAEWARQSSPQDPSLAQIAHIKSRQGLEALNPPQVLSTHEGHLDIVFRLPLQATSLLEIEPADPGTTDQ